MAGLSRAGLSPGCRTPDSAAASARAEAQAPKRSLTSEFDYRTAHDEGLTEWGEVCEETIWENIGYFLQAIIPVAEQAGVQMALHPDDPPISRFAALPGSSPVARISGVSSTWCPVRRAASRSARQVSKPWERISKPWRESGHRGSVNQKRVPRPGGLSTPIRPW